MYLSLTVGQDKWVFVCLFVSLCFSLWGKDLGPNGLLPLLQRLFLLESKLRKYMGYFKDV